MVLLILQVLLLLVWFLWAPAAVLPVWLVFMPLIVWGCTMLFALVMFILVAIGTVASRPKWR